MKKSFFDLQLFSDGTEITDSAAAMGDGNSTGGISDTAETAAEDTAVQDEAAEVTVSVGDGTAESDRSESDINREAEELERTARILLEADLLSEKVSGFDLQKEMADSSFAAMVKNGVPVETAWKAVHFDQLLDAAVQEAREEALCEALAKIRNMPDRPSENGAVSQAAIQSRAGVDNLTGRGIREILRRVENGAKVKF